MPTRANEPRWRLALPNLYSVGTPAPDEVASGLLESIGYVSGRVDLETFFIQWPGLRHSAMRLDSSGYLIDLGNRGGEIVVNQSESGVRQNFTLAHEFGHWLLGPTETEVSRRARSVQVDDPSVEAWCDAFAAALLLPATTLRDNLADRSLKERWKVVIALPKQLGVSRAAALRRLAELSLASSIRMRTDFSETQQFYAPILTNNEKVMLALSLRIAIETDQNYAVESHPVFAAREPGVPFVTAVYCHPTVA